MEHIKKNRKNGFTLIEVIIGIALFGIIAICLIPLFSTGFVNIHNSGSKTEALYENQKTIETNGATNPTSEVIYISFDSKDVEIDINTFRVEKEYDTKGNKTSIFYFEANMNDSD